MSANRLDLLPEDRRRSLRRAYLLRVGTVVAVLAIILLVVAAVLLIPTYIYLVSAERTQSARLATIESRLSSEDQTTLGKRLTALEADAKEIASLSTTPSASEVIRKVLVVGRSGIVLTRMSYAPTLGTLSLSGTAATRNDLRAYQIALSSAPGFSSANLPVSSYARDHDIPFAIAVTLATSTSP